MRKNLRNKIWSAVQGCKASSLILSTVDNKVSNQVWDQFRNPFDGQIYLSIKNKLK